MKRLNRLMPAWLAMFAVIALLAQSAQDRYPRRRGQEESETPKIKTEDILKEDYKNSLKDAGELVKLAEEVKSELEKNDMHILSVSTLKKTEDIEKVAHRLHGRLRKF